MNKYDCVVIGAGTGGLSAALAMAVNKKKVLLIEQHNLPGGCSSSFIRGRFEFDASLHEYCGIGSPKKWGMPGKVMMEDYKMDVKWLLVPEMYRAIGTARSGKKYDFVMPCGEENIIAEMEKQVPGSKEPMKTFFELAHECDEAYNYFHEHMDEFDKRGFVKTDDNLFMKKYPNFLRIGERPFNQVLRKIHMPEDAIDLLNIYWTYIGTDYERLSFVHMAWMFLMYATLQPAICKYNAHGMTVAGIERFRELGGEVWQNVKGEKVVSDEDGNIKGVQTSVGFVETNYVIANVNPQNAYTQLLDDNIKVPVREIQRANVEKHGVRFLEVYVACNKSAKDLGFNDYSIFTPGSFDTKLNYQTSKSLEKSVHPVVVCYNVVDPDFSPEGTCCMTFTITYTEDVWGNISQRDYVKTKQRIAREVIENFEDDTGISIMPYIEEIEIATPWTFANYLGTPQGTTYGYECSEWDTMVSRLMSYRKDQPIHGFKTVGAAGARGDGYSQTYINGEDIAKLTLKEMERQGE